MKSFIRLWIGQLISIIGSGMTTFALGIFIYTKTGRVSDFAWLYFLGTFPGMLISPLCGVLADRYSRKKLMIIGDSGAAIATIGIIFLFVFNTTPNFYLLLLFVALNSFFSAFQFPAFQAAVTQIVPITHLPYASGMLQAANAASLIISPILSGVVYAYWGMNVIFAIDLITFLVGVSATAITHIPKIVAVSHNKYISILTDIKLGWKYCMTHKKILHLLVMLGVSNFLIGFLIILIGPMILTMATPELYGIGQTISAMGMLISSIVVSIFGVPRKVSLTFYASIIICGIGYFFIGFGQTFFSIVCPTFVFFLALPYLNSAIDYLIRSSTIEEMQGRVFSFLNIFIGIATLSSYLLAGPLSDSVFEPIFKKTDSGNILFVFFGHGPGRGMGFLLSVAGFILIVIGIHALLKRKVGNVVIENNTNS